jgi:hypothetical protein
MAYIPVGLYVYPLGPGCVSTIDPDRRLSVAIQRRWELLMKLLL